MLRMGPLQEIDDIFQDILIDKRQVLPQDPPLFFRFREVEVNLRLQAAVDVFGNFKSRGSRRSSSRKCEIRDAPKLSGLRQSIRYSAAYREGGRARPTIFRSSGWLHPRMQTPPRIMAVTREEAT